MAEHKPLQIVIVGGGASGALMAAHLLRRDPKGVEITIVETRARLGRGLAYATANPSHLLNVRAANMSAFADDPGHFARWLKQHAEPSERGLDPEYHFVSRGLYGRYLEALVAPWLTPPQQGKPLAFRRTLARAVVETPISVEVQLADGESLRADVAVLACGHESVETTDPLYASPWDEPVGGALPRDGAVLILGAGLTMVDAALALEGQGHRGPILALSRRGLLSHAHRRVDPLPLDAEAAKFDVPISTLLQRLRQRARDAAARGIDWRSVVDGLRPHTQAIWRAMTPERRVRFLEHGRPWWDIHRHRMAPSVEARIKAMIARSQLEIVAGRLVEVEPTPGGARIALRRRGESRLEHRDVARIVSCVGVRHDPAQTHNPVLTSLFAQGLARVDPLHIGIDVAPDCAVIDSRGRASSRLFAIGPMSQAAFWEIIAVPDIRLQTEELARRLLATTQRENP